MGGLAKLPFFKSQRNASNLQGLFLIMKLINRLINFQKKQNCEKKKRKIWSPGAQKVK